MKNADLPAMPIEGVISDTDEVWAFQTGNNAEFQFVGLTKREMFAMRFMGHLCDVYWDTVSEYDSGKQLIECQAETAIEMADILLAKLEKTNEK